MNEYRDNICKRLRLTAAEFGQKNLDGAILVGPYHDIEQLGGHKYLCCETLAETKLAGVDYKMSRFFEDCVVEND